MPQKAKGFGQPQTPTRDAKRFMLAFRECAVQAKGSEIQIQQFLQSNLDKLDESLLAALPTVFTTLTVNQSSSQRKAIANLFVWFGNAVFQFPRGERGLNLEISITVYNLSLKVFTRKAFPEHWAGIQNNLGSAYTKRIRGDRAENLELAITAYEKALQVYTQAAFPKDWAGTQNNLGNAYLYRIQGDRAENLELAITAYEKALQVYTQAAFPEDWATTQNNLGTAYSDRIQGDRAENLEQAITAYEKALQVYTQAAFPEAWARTQNNLGNAYRDRIQGDRAENLEQAIATHEKALQVYTQAAFPEAWARTQHNLANAYRDRLHGEPIENLEQATTIYGQAAQVFTREGFPLQWAENQSNLAEALMKRATLTDDLSDLDTAVTLLQDALEVAAAGSPDWIDSHYRLGNALSHRFHHSQTAADLEQALAAYKVALDAINPEHYDRQRIWQALPTTQSILGRRLVRDGKWQEGLQLLTNSVRLLSHSDDRLAHANALFDTGRAYEVLSDWDNARIYYRDALRLYDHLKHQSGIARSQVGLGSVLVSQGHLEKGMAELAKAQAHYQQVAQPDEAAKVEQLYQVAQQALQKQAEVYA